MCAMAITELWYALNCVSFIVVAEAVVVLIDSDVVEYSNTGISECAGFDIVIVVVIVIVIVVVVVDIGDGVCKEDVVFLLLRLLR